MAPAIRFLIASALLIIPAALHAQEPPPAEPEDRPTGLPARITWTFNFDAGWGNFGFGNSLFNNPKEPGVDENLSDQWFEGYVKPALSATYTLASSSEIYGKVSAVGERTYGSVPAAFGEDVSSFGPEDLYIGWRSGKSLSIGENAVDFSVGREQYQLGHGFLLYDGAAEGGSRGGYWTNARKAFEFAAVGRVNPGRHKAEVFYLDKDELPGEDSGSRLWGANYEVQLQRPVDSRRDVHEVVRACRCQAGARRPERLRLPCLYHPYPLDRGSDGRSRVRARRQRRGSGLKRLDLQGAYQFSNAAWKPKLSYRYAFFQGDDVTTPKNEAFDPLFLGFNDWGTWWQGEIAGEYFLSNSNLKSHEIRVHTTPTEAIGTGLIFFNFNLDRPASFAPGVTAKDVANELDWYMDWKINENFTASFVAVYRRSGQGSPARLRPHEKLHLRNGVPGVCLLTSLVVSWPSRWPARVAKRMSLLASATGTRDLGAVPGPAATSAVPSITK